ncbi:MAG: Endonuclease YhcR precursor [bacterium ADurb.Bin429]|nr:MAG: Endonuclease YhcR precursor [bacterium ADurb.Bin429]
MSILRLRVICALASLLTLPLWSATVQILATGDMHGWLEPQITDGQVYGGPGQMLAYWKTAEKYVPQKFLVVSCGDIATGPTLSTVFKGQPAVEMMNLMGYDLSVVGNHEFDFGEEGLKKLTQWARFPFLAGNLRNADGTMSSMVGNSLLYEEQGVKVGVIALTVKDLARYANIGSLKVQAYADAVRALAAGLRGRGAKTIIIAAHAEMAALEKLANDVADLNIPLILGGHSHEFGQKKVGDTWVINSGEWWKGYSRIDLEVDSEEGTALVRAAKQVWLQQDAKGVKIDRQAAELIETWTKRLPAEDREIIAYTATGLTRHWGIANLVVDSWLAIHPADVAIVNMGGLRQDFAPGAIRRMDLYGVMPFNNSLLRMKLTGKQLADYQPPGEILHYGGLRIKDGHLLFAGQPLNPAETYRILIIDYLYNTSPHLKTADPNPERVDDHWRNPVIRWLTAHQTDKKTTLESLTDLLPRSE